MGAAGAQGGRTAPRGASSGISLHHYLLLLPLSLFFVIFFFSSPNPAAATCTTHAPRTTSCQRHCRWLSNINHQLMEENRKLREQIAKMMDRDKRFFSIETTTQPPQTKPSASNQVPNSSAGQKDPKSDSTRPWQLLIILIILIILRPRPC